MIRRCVISHEVSPEICVEVVSESNLLALMQEKMRLYFDAGALEVWLCDLQGQMRFYNPDGELAGSSLCPAFPTEIQLP
jgi:Uma2 family endonuclease